MNTHNENATQAQVKYINALLKRIKRGSNKEQWDRLLWIRENVETLTKSDASSWIDTLRQMVRDYNMIQARYSINGRGKQI